MTTRATKDDEIRELKAQLEALRAEMAALTSNLQGVLEERQAADREQATAEGATDEAAGDLEALQRKLEDLRESGKAAAERLAQDVEAHPLLSLGVAFGAGYLLARITGVFR